MGNVEISINSALPDRGICALFYDPSTPGDREIAEANARLIIAAPKMVKEIKEILSEMLSYGQGMGRTEKVIRLREIIAEIETPQ